MSKFNLDFSKFKKISQDSKSAVLRHPEGHEVKIAIGNLSSRLKEHLSKLPMQEEKVQKFARGGKTESVPIDLEADMPDPEQLLQLEQQQVAQQQEQMAQQGAAEQAKPYGTGQNVIMGSGEVMNQAPAPAVQKQIPQQAPEQYAATEPEQDMTPEPPRAAPVQRQPVQAQPLAAPVEPEPVEESLPEIKQKSLTAHKQDTQRMVDDLHSGVITPQTYHSLFADKSTMGKIGAIFGALAGGASAGTLGGQNPFMAAWDKIITNDLEAQKANMSNKNSFMRLNMESALNKEHVIGAQLANKASQMDLSRKQMNLVALKDLSETIKKFPPGSPQALDAQKKYALIYPLINAQNASLDDQMASRDAFMKSIQGMGEDNNEEAFKNKMQTLRMSGNEQLVKDMEAKHVPGVGQASKEVPGDVMKELISRQDLQDKINDLKAFASKNSGALKPSVIAEGKAKAALVQDAYRRANAQGVFKESEKNFVGTIIGSNPTQFFEKYRAGKGYEEMGRDNLSTLNNLKTGYGLPTKAEQAAPEFQMRNGIKYMKVKGGWDKVR